MFQLTMFKSLPSCYPKPTLNSHNFTSLLSAWILFLSFCNIAVNLSLKICSLLRVSNCFSALRYSWIIPSKTTAICLLFILSSHSVLFFANLTQLLLVCSGFLPGDSCISQLLPIVHDINSSFGCDPTQDVRGIFLYISKAFDKGWHEGLLFKLKMDGVKGVLSNLLWNYLHERNERVVRNGQISSWGLIRSGGPQGLVLGPLLFLIYTNDLSDNIQSTCNIFANDISLFPHFFDKYRSQSELNNDLQIISNWAFQWKMQFNPDPNKQAQEIYLSNKSNNENSLPVTFNPFMTEAVII